MATKKTTTTKRSTSSKATPKAKNRTAVVSDFQPNKMSLAVSALAATTLVLFALVTTM